MRLERSIGPHMLNILLTASSFLLRLFIQAGQPTSGFLQVLALQVEVGKIKGKGDIPEEQDKSNEVGHSHHILREVNQ